LRGELRGCGERVVRLELDHGPDPHAERAQCVLERMKLREQLGLDARARFVAGPEIVAERLDDVVGRDAEVCGAALEHAEDRAQHADDGADFVAVRVGLPRHGIEVPEQLVRAVEEMNSQTLMCPNRSARTAGSRIFQTTPSVK